MLTSSGQAANFFALFNICENGSHIVSSASIYGGTFNLIEVTMKKMGIDVTFVEPDCTEEELNAAFKENTRAVFGESIANPALTVLDIEKFAKAAHAHGVPLIVDNTFPTPVNLRPIEWGADIVTHSTTKYMDGHGAAVGGAIVDSGKFDWMAHADKFPGLCTPDDSYHGITYAEKFGKEGAFITKCTAQLMRDFGCIQSPQHAFILNLGLESLHVRMPRHVENGQAVAEFLEANDKVLYVNYPGLPSYKYYDVAKKYMPNGGCGVVSFLHIRRLLTLQVGNSGYSLDITDNKVMDDKAYQGHGLTAQDIMSKAGNTNVKAQKDFMIVMSNSVSGKTWRKCRKKAFSREVQM